MTKTHLKRLQKLLEHMEKGELSVDKFDFGAFRRGPFERERCDTAGCMGGELPALFPRLWKWEVATPVLRDARRASTFSESAERFFGLTTQQAGRLFYPQGDWKAQTDSLPGNATRRQVTANLRRFIKSVTPKN